MRSLCGLPTNIRNLYHHSRKTTLLLMITGLVLSFLFMEEARFSAQAQAGSNTSWLRQSIDSGGFQDFAIGDLNGDGAFDMAGVRGAFKGNPAILLNDGYGSLSLANNPIEWRTSSSLASVALGDLNGDGLLDIAAGHPSGAVDLFMNDGSRTFTTDVTIQIEQDDPIIRLLLGDLNGDSRLDLAVIGPNIVVFNRGEGTFETGGRFDCSDGQVVSAALGDLNRDGYLDIAAGRQGEDRLYFGDGTGQFLFSLPFGSVDSAAVSDPAEFAPGDDFELLGDPASRYREFLDQVSEQIGVDAAQDEQGISHDVVLADLNTDGRLDIVTAAGQVYLNELNSFSVNGPGCQAGNFTGSTGSLRVDARWNMRPADTMTAGDVDGDGWLDVISGRLTSQNEIYLNPANTPDSVLKRAIPFGPGGDRTQKVAAADLNRDSAVDLVVSDETRLDAVYLNYLPAQVKDYQSLDYPSSTAVTAAGEGSSLSQGQPRIPSLAVADLNGDGRLDIAATRWNAPDRLGEIYLSRLDGGFTSQPIGDRGDVRSLVLADFNGDRSLDLAAGLFRAQSRVFFNDGRGNFSAAQPFGSENGTTQALAAGDMDSDGDLDLVVGSAGFSQNLIFFNDGTGQFSAGQPFGPRSTSLTTSLVVGDLDGDNDLDIVTGRSVYGLFGSENRVYLNDGQGGFDWEGSIRPFGNGRDTTQGVALGDVDGDGDLDIAAGNAWTYRQDAVYLNDGQGNFQWEGSERLFGSGTDNTNTVTLHDFDGDGDLDIVSGNERWKTFYCVNCPVNLGENESQFNAVYLNDGNGYYSVARTFGSGDTDLRSLAMGDMDRDGDLDLVAGQNIPLDSGAAVSSANHLGKVAIWWNRVRQPVGLANQPTSIVITGPEQMLQSGTAAPIASLQDAIIPIRYQLSDLDGDAVGSLRSCYSLDGGGSWLLALQEGEARPRPDQVVRPTQGCPYVQGKSSPATGSISNGQESVYRWDTFNSGFFGQSERVVFRFEVYPQGGSASHRVPDVFQLPYASTTTGFFSARGTSVRVVQPGSVPGQVEPVNGARVFRLPDGQASGATLIGVTGADGYLKQRGEIGRGDLLVALAPVDVQPAYTRFNTNYVPTETGIDAYEVTVPGIQELVVLSDQPLVLFNMDISLEWDARNDGEFLSSLSEAVKRSSEVLFDVSNGQMALGQVRIYQAKENWLQADTVIYASNNIRPRATMGGVTTEPLDDLTADGKVLSGAYQTGQIRMGPNWDPFGENRADLGEDWWRAFAHEFGHYYLYMPDDYLGYDERGFIRTIDCKGSFMTTAYDDGYSEFLNADQWKVAANNCQSTIAQWLTGRSNWDTILKFYPFLKAGTPEQVGPLSLPVELADIQLIAPTSDPATLSPRNIDLRRPAGERVSLPNGQVFLIQSNGTPQDLEDDRVLALGTTSNQDFIKVRGAVPADRLCVFQIGATSADVGCIEEMGSLMEAIPVRPVSEWQPDIEVKAAIRPTLVMTVTRSTAGQLPQVDVLASSDEMPVVSVKEPDGENPGVITIDQPKMEFEFQYPVTPTLPYQLVIFEPTLNVKVTQPGLSGTVNAQVYPAYGPGDSEQPWRSPLLALQPSEEQPGQFSQLFVLDYPALNGYVRVWVSDQPGKEAMSEFYLSPSWGVDLRGGGRVDLRGGGGVDLRGGGGVDLRGTWRVDLRGGGGVDLRGGGQVDLRGGGSVDLRGGGRVDLRGGGRVDLRGGGGVDLRGGGRAPTRIWGANQRAMGAPVASSDGHVTIFNSANFLADTATETLEALVSVQGLPSWLTPVGQAYRFTSSENLPRTIAFNYMQRDVPDGYEYALKLYYLALTSGARWKQLPTILDERENLAVAQVQGDGIYALAASVEVYIPSSGWYLFAYPMPDQRPVGEALRSIEGLYSTVYGYEPDAKEPWKVYDAGVEAWVNNLDLLEFGRGYWIQVQQPVTISFAIPISATLPSAPQSNYILTTPNLPATLYGEIPPSVVRSTAATVTVKAYVYGSVCGETAAQRTGNVYRFRIQVEGATPDRPTCGGPGRSVILRIGSRTIATRVWDNSRPIHIEEFFR